MRNNASVAVHFELYRFGQTLLFFSLAKMYLRWAMNGQRVMFSANKWVHILSTLSAERINSWDLDLVFCSPYYDNDTQSSSSLPPVTKYILKHKLRISEASIDIKTKIWASANHDLVMSSFTLIFSGRSSFSKKTIYLFRVDCTIGCSFVCWCSFEIVCLARPNYCGREKNTSNTHTHTHSGRSISNSMKSNDTEWNFRHVTTTKLKNDRCTDKSVSFLLLIWRNEMQK